MLRIKNNAISPSASLMNTTPALPTASSNRCSHVVASSPRTEEYYVIWASWEKNAPAGLGEQRDVAVARIHDALERSNDFLDLSKLNLSSLPENIPAHIKKMNISRNFLCNLPEDLRELDASCNKLY